MGVEGLFTLMGSMITAQSNASIQAANAAAQSELNQETMEFNRKEAEKARAWQASQGNIDRSFNSVEAEKARKFNATQAASAFDWSANQYKLQRDFNAREALKQRNWEANQANIARNFNAEQTFLAQQFEERMSSTAHQREVQDLYAAGLNPILSVTGGAGASTPVAPILSSPMPTGVAATSSAGSMSGASGPSASHGTGSAPASHVGNLTPFFKKSVMNSFMSTALDGLRLDNDMKRAKADLMHAEAHMKEATTGEKRQVADERYIDQQISNLKKDNVFKDWQIKSEQEKVQLFKTQIVNAVKQQLNNDRLTDAQVAQCGALAYQAVKNADTEAAYKSKMAEVAEAKGEAEQKKLQAEADTIRKDLFSGRKKLEHEFYNSGFGRSIYILDKITQAASPIKLFNN